MKHITCDEVKCIKKKISLNQSKLHKCAKKEKLRAESEHGFHFVTERHVD